MKEDIIRMAREAGLWLTSDERIAAVERFAALVADAEAKRMHDAGFVTVGHMRQQIAAEREEIIQMMPGGSGVDPQWVCDAIRARSDV